MPANAVPLRVKLPDVVGVEVVARGAKVTPFTVLDVTPAVPSLNAAIKFPAVFMSVSAPIIDTAPHVIVAANALDANSPATSATVNINDFNVRI